MGTKCGFAVLSIAMRNDVTRHNANVVDAEGVDIMDATTIIIAVVLLVILFAWYILLEFDERAHKRKADRRNYSAEPAEPAAQRERKHDEP